MILAAWGKHTLNVNKPATSWRKSERFEHTCAKYWHRDPMSSRIAAPPSPWCFGGWLLTAGQARIRWGRFIVTELEP